MASYIGTNPPQQTGIVNRFQLQLLLVKQYLLGQMLMVIRFFIYLLTQL